MSDKIDFSKWRTKPTIRIRQSPTITLQSLYDELGRDGFAQRIDKLWGLSGRNQKVEAMNR